MSRPPGAGSAVRLGASESMWDRWTGSPGGAGGGVAGGVIADDARRSEAPDLDSRVMETGVVGVVPVGGTWP